MLVDTHRSHEPPPCFCDRTRSSTLSCLIILPPAPLWYTPCALTPRDKEILARNNEMLLNDKEQLTARNKQLVSDNEELIKDKEVCLMRNLTIIPVYGNLATTGAK